MCKPNFVQNNKERNRKDLPLGISFIVLKPDEMRLPYVSYLSLLDKGAKYVGNTNCTPIYYGVIIYGNSLVDG